VSTLRRLGRWLAGAITHAGPTIAASQRFTGTRTSNEHLAENEILRMAARDRARLANDGSGPEKSP
jgi:hypothetical protein